MNDYEKLFVQYIEEMRNALARANAWWRDLEAKTRASAGSDEEGRLALENRWPFGPSTHPWVLGVYRKYYLIVNELNARYAAQADESAPEPTEEDWGDEDEEAAAKKTAPTDAPPDAVAEAFLLVGEDSPFYEATEVRPRAFLIDALYGRADDLADALTWMIYPPIGRDNAGNVF